MNKEEKELIEVFFEVYGVPVDTKVSTKEIKLDDSWIGFEVIPFLKNEDEDSDK